MYRTYLCFLIQLQILQRLLIKATMVEKNAIISQFLWINVKEDKPFTCCRRNTKLTDKDQVKVEVTEPFSLRRERNIFVLMWMREN